MKKTICTVLIATTLTACAGRTPMPVQVNQMGDRSKSCAALENEANRIGADIQRLQAEGDKTASNVALGIAGWFFIIPWFFMDLKGAQAIELAAAQQRQNILLGIMDTKKCAPEAQ